MDSNDKSSYRVVIQHSPGSADDRFPYVLIVYGGYTGKAFAPLQYQSVPELLERLWSAGVSVPEQKLCIQDTDGVYVVFSGEIELNEAQVYLLGLKVKA